MDRCSILILLAKILIALLLQMISHNASASIIYVKSNATGTNTGQNWQNAFSKIEPALLLSQTGDEIWIAKGTYSPYKAWNTDSSTYFVPSGVRIFGGFLGTETSLQQRNWNQNEVVIGNTVKNVFYFENTDGNTLIDGCSINNGSAFIFPQDQETVSCFDSPNGSLCSGGGIYLYSTNVNHPAFLTVKNCKFINNLAHYGGGLSANFLAGAGGIIIDHCDFKENVSLANYSSGNYGGGVQIAISPECSSPVIIKNSTFTSNKAYFGGTPALEIINLSHNALVEIDSCVFMQNQGSGGPGCADLRATSETNKIKLRNCTFTGNSSNTGEGNPYLGAAISGRNLEIDQCIFKSNLGNQGGMLSSLQINVVNSLFLDNIAKGNSAVIHAGLNTSIINCTFYRNTNLGDGGIIGGWPNTNFDTIVNCIFVQNLTANNMPVSIFSPLSGDTSSFMDYILVDVSNKSDLIHGYSPQSDSNKIGEHIYYNLIPQFLDTINGDFRLSACSDALNKGSLQAVERFSINHDLGNNSRVLDSLPDLGAYETKGINISNSNQSVSCPHGDNGELVPIIIGGFQPYHLKWENGSSDSIRTNIAPGSYTLSVTDNFGCVKSINMEINAPASWEITPVVQSASSMSATDGAITLSPVLGGAEPYSATWSNGQNGLSVNHLKGGMLYTVTITDSNNCDTTVNIFLDYINRVDDGQTIINKLPIFYISAGRLFIDAMEPGTLSCNIWSLSGQLLKTTEVLYQQGTTTELLPSNYLPGVYQVQILNKDGIGSVVRWVKT